MPDPDDYSEPRDFGYYRWPDVTYDDIAYDAALDAAMDQG